MKTLFTILVIISISSNVTVAMAWGHKGASHSTSGYNHTQSFKPFHLKFK